MKEEEGDQNLAVGRRTEKQLTVFTALDHWRVVVVMGGWGQSKTVPLRPCFNAALKLKPGFTSRSEQSHLCSRGEERGRNTASPAPNINTLTGRQRR